MTDIFLIKMTYIWHSNPKWLPLAHKYFYFSFSKATVGKCQWAAQVFKERQTERNEKAWKVGSNNFERWKHKWTNLQIQKAVTISLKATYTGFWFLSYTKLTMSNLFPEIIQHDLIFIWVYPTLLKVSVDGPRCKCGMNILWDMLGQSNKLVDTLLYQIWLHFVFVLVKSTINWDTSFSIYLVFKQRWRRCTISLSQQKSYCGWSTQQKK